MKSNVSRYLAVENAGKKRSMAFDLGDIIDQNFGSKLWIKSRQNIPKVQTFEVTTATGRSGLLPFDSWSPDSYVV